MNNYFSVTLTYEIPNNLVDAFWKCIKIKAKSEALFVDGVSTCNVVEQFQNGFIREIGVTNQPACKQEVVFDEINKSASFYSLSANDGDLFSAVNKIVSEHEKKHLLIEYVYKIDKNSKLEKDVDRMKQLSHVLSERVESMLSKMKEVIIAEKINAMYQALFQDD